MDKDDVKFVREFASAAAGAALSNALTAQTAMIGSLLRTMLRRGLIKQEDIAMFCNEAADPLSRFIELDDGTLNNEITSALRSYADGILKLGELGVGDVA